MQSTSAQVPVRPVDDFQAALTAGRFLIQRCTQSGNYVFHPRVLSPWTGRATLEWVEASGGGSVYSTTVVRRKPERGGDYNVAIVQLDEGPMMMSSVRDVAPDAVSIDQRVKASIIEIEGKPTVVFVPEDSSQ